jgi:hypothetical protein
MFYKLYNNGNGKDGEIFSIDKKISLGIVLLFFILLIQIFTIILFINFVKDSGISNVITEFEKTNITISQVGETFKNIQTALHVGKEMIPNVLAFDLQVQEFMIFVRSKLV